MGDYGKEKVCSLLFACIDCWLIALVCSSFLEYSELFTRCAFEGTTPAFDLLCTLVSPDGRPVTCSACFTIRKDVSRFQMDIDLAVSSFLSFRCSRFLIFPVSSSGKTESLPLPSLIQKRVNHVACLSSLSTKQPISPPAVKKRSRPLDASFCLASTF